MQIIFAKKSSQQRRKISKKKESKEDELNPQNFQPDTDPVMNMQQICVKAYKCSEYMHKIEEKIDETNAQADKANANRAKLQEEKVEIKDKLKKINIELAECDRAIENKNESIATLPQEKSQLFAYKNIWIGMIRNELPKEQKGTKNEKMKNKTTFKKRKRQTMPTSKTAKESDSDDGFHNIHEPKAKKIKIEDMLSGSEDSD